MESGRTHRLLKPGGLLPEEPLPGWEVGALKQGVLQDALHASERLDNVCPVVVQVPQLPCTTGARTGQVLHGARSTKFGY